MWINKQTKKGLNTYNFVFWCLLEKKQNKNENADSSNDLFFVDILCISKHSQIYGQKYKFKYHIHKITNLLFLNSNSLHPSVPGGEKSCFHGAQFPHWCCGDVAMVIVGLCDCILTQMRVRLTGEFVCCVSIQYKMQIYIQLHKKQL